MKATDLMIGDFVYAYETLSDNLTNKVVIRVESVSSGLTFTGGGGKYCDYDDACPIPLTEEILKANGFKIESDGYNWYHPTFSPEQVYVHVALRHNGKVRRVEVKKQRAHFYRDTLPYDFSVHKLQHAFRLCGLSELADGFKVEEEE